MTDRIEALRAFRADVEAGDKPSRDEWRAVFPDMPDDDDYPRSEMARAAADGYLEAARALHEAVLPGWHWQTWYGVAGYTAVLDGPEVSTEEITQDNPARAWLTAILSALISQAEQSQ